MELTHLQGREVVNRDGRRIGKVADLAIQMSLGHPALTHILVRTSPRSTMVIPWSRVGGIDDSRLELRDPEPDGDATIPDDLLLLGRDVLDCQVYDAAGKRLARVGDVRLQDDGGTVRVVGVEVGAGVVMRRLGLARLARRLHEDPIDWTDVHLASARGHALTLNAKRVHRLTPTDLAELLGHLPANRGADLLEGLPPPIAAEALRRARRFSKWFPGRHRYHAIRRPRP